MLRSTDVEVALVVEGGIVDGYVILECTEVITGIGNFSSAVIIIDDAIHADNEHGLGAMLDESDRCSTRRLEVFSENLAFALDESGKSAQVATLPEIMMLVFVDVCEKHVGIALGVCFFLFNKVLRGICSFYVFSMNACFWGFDGVKSIARRSQQNISSVALYDGVDSWLSAIREMKSGEIVGLIVVAHQALGTTYPEVSLLVN